jgi:hypothetical protein
MSSRQALGAALRDFYANSWRLVAVNAALGASLVAVGLAVAAVRAALVLLVLAGPHVAAVAHSAIVLQRTGSLTSHDALEGLQLHWRRGLVLGAGGAALLLLGVVAIGTYARHGVWVLAFAATDVLVAVGIIGLFVALLSIAEPDRPLREAGRHALELVVRRPGATLGFGVALLVLNVAGLAAAVMPFLTLTVVYSFVAAAHFALPRPEELV